MRKMFREAAFEVMWDDVEKSADIKDAVESLVAGSFTTGFIDGIIVSIESVAALALIKLLLKKLVK